MFSEFFGVQSNNVEDFFINARKSKISNDDNQIDFDVKTNFDEEKKAPNYNDFFHSNPINFLNKKFQDESEVFIQKIDVDIKTVIESYTKSIRK